VSFQGLDSQPAVLFLVATDNVTRAKGGEMATSERLLRQVKDRLEPDESVLNSVIGLVGESDVDGLKTISMFATTDKRLVLLTKRMVGYQLEGFAYASVASFEMREGVRGHELSFLASGNRVRMTRIAQGDVASFTATIRERGPDEEASRTPSG
jgi:PH (Pleckstrin Homology) domain-containing protein